MRSDPIPNGFHHAGNCIRPPSEANSILLQATLGCSHSKFTFCAAYKDKKFAIKDRMFLEHDLEFTTRYCKHQDSVFVMERDSLGFISELRDLVKHTRLSRGAFYSNHASNYLPMDARFFQDKTAVLKTLDQALSGNINLKPEWMRGL